VPSIHCLTGGPRSRLMRERGRRVRTASPQPVFQLVVVGRDRSPSSYAAPLTELAAPSSPLHLKLGCSRLLQTIDTARCYNEPELDFRKVRQCSDDDNEQHRAASTWVAYDGIVWAEDLDGRARALFACSPENDDN
jgi:hypothetical protein